MEHAEVSTMGETMVRKRCNRCGKLKPPSSYFRRKESRDGRQHYCKLCDRRRSNALGVLAGTAMTYAELGYLRAIHDVATNECATKAEKEQAQVIFAALCARLELSTDTAETFCEALGE